MYNTHLEFHSGGDNRAVCFSPAGCCSRSQCGQQDSRLFISSHSRTPSASLRGYATPPFGEIWSCRSAGGPVLACIHGAIVPSTMDSYIIAPYIGLHASTVNATVSAIVARRPVAATVTATIAPYATACARQPRCWRWVWRYIRGQYPSLATSEGAWGRYRSQKRRSLGKLLHFPSWNVSWLNSWKSNPMYNTHPKLYSKILRK